MNDTTNLRQFQDPFFTEVVARCVAECVDYYGGRLAAIYVWGSVHRHEAVRGVSDLDLVVFVKSGDVADRKWRNDHVNDRLEKEYPDLAWGLIPHACGNDEAPRGTIATDTEQEQMRNRSWAYLLHHNATLVFGEEVTMGLVLPPPDRSFARWALAGDPMQLARYAAGLEAENRSDFELPADPSLKLRKLARLAVLGGACLLMARGTYKSDKGGDVLPLLSKGQEAWADFLECTGARYIHPVEASPAQVQDYSLKLIAWLDWIQRQLD